MTLRKENYKILVLIDKLFEIFPCNNYLLVSGLISFLIFLIALIISFIANFPLQFLCTVPIYLANLGIFFVLVYARWGSLNYLHMWDEIKECFEVTDKEYYEVVDKWLRKIFSNKKIFIIYFLIIIPICYGTLRFFESESEEKFNIIPRLLPDVWYVHDAYLIFKVSIIIIYAIPILLLLITPIWGFLGHILLTNEIGKFPISEIYTASQKLKKLANFSLVCSVGWFVGVSLIIICLRDSLVNPIALYSTIFLTFVGLIIFFIPQISIHSVLEKKKNDILLKIEKEYEEVLKVLLSKERETNVKKLIAKIDALERIKSYTENKKTWIYDVPTILRLALSSALPIVTFLISVISKNL